MQQLILACGVNPFGYIIFFFILVIPFVFTVGIKYFFLSKTHRSPHRSLWLDSFGLTFITGIVMSLVIGSIYVVPSSLFVIEIGFLFSFQIIIWAIVCIIDTFLIKHWSLKSKEQAIALTSKQQLQVEPINGNYLSSWAASILSNTIIGILGAALFSGIF